MINILQPERTHRLAIGRRSCLAGVSAVALSACTASSPAAKGGPKPNWDLSDIPSQVGRVFVVTGGTSGIGYESSKALAAAGAQVVIAARSPERGEEAIASIRQEVPDARLRFERLDLAVLPQFARCAYALLPHCHAWMASSTMPVSWSRLSESHRQTATRCSLPSTIWATSL